MTDRRQRIAIQRAMAQEAIGKLKAIIEMFGVEEEASHTDKEREEFLAFSAKIASLEKWIFQNSPIA